MQPSAPDDATNESRNLEINPDGNLVERVSAITVVQVRDMEGRHLGTIDVEHCETLRDIHLAMLDTLWQHYRKEGYSPSENADNLRRGCDRLPKGAPLVSSLAAFLREKEPQVEAGRYLDRRRTNG